MATLTKQWWYAGCVSSMYIFVVIFIILYVHVTSPTVALNKWSAILKKTVIIYKTQGAQGEVKKKKE